MRKPMQQEPTVDMMMDDDITERTLVPRALIIPRRHSRHDDITERSASTPRPPLLTAAVAALALLIAVVMGHTWVDALALLVALGALVMLARKMH